MKYNPRVNEFVARLEGSRHRAPFAARGAFAGLPAHPL
jgi:hypothetical protein